MFVGKLAVHCIVWDMEAEGLFEHLCCPVTEIKCLQFTQEHKDWTVEHWNKVMWFNESCFQLHHADGRVRIWRKQHESMQPTCMSTTLQADGGSVMVWGMFSWHDLGPLLCVEQHLNSTTYLSIIAGQLHPIMLMAYPNGDGFFQQDYAPGHGAHIVQEWFQEHEGNFTLLRWSPQSPDLNPIEHLWNEAKRAIRQLVPQPSNLTELTVLFIRHGVRFLASPFDI
uniref:Tc1-like transposase DDE domain-containing protein n=1 Tax=Myotis myotis TaxID=51298 RepID=A0A7J7VI47_MYOMY|nr:hypothetical protein mMyoMyo1_008338 [Myotis myotis]